MPAVAALDDLGFRGAAQRLLVEGVGDDLADGLGHAPVVEDLLDVQVEQRRPRSRQLRQAQASTSTRYSGAARAAT